MMRPWLWMTATAVCLVTSIPGSVGAGPAPMSGPISQPRTVLTETDAFALLPPELVAAPVVTNLSFSSNGRYILAERTNMRITSEMLRAAQAGREPPPGEVSLVLWDSRQRTSREIWKAPLAGTSIQQFAWLPQTDVAVALVLQSQGAEHRQTLLRIAGGADRAQMIPLVDPGGSATLSLHISPGQSLAIVQQTTEV
jgi:hypothetical protein